MLTLCLALATSSAFATDRPNVILIMTDDQGYGDLSITGNPVLKTPNIDRLAREGVWLKRFYVSPVCTPTRASLMTGRYNFRTRAIDTYIGRAMMEPDEVTVAEVLRDAGYATGIFGKWHLGDCYPMRAMDQGFGESLVHKGGGLQQPSNPPEGNTYFDPILWHNGKSIRTKGWCTDLYFDAALGYVESQHKAGKPFFAYLPVNAVHDPLDEVPQDKYEHYKALAANDKDARVFAMAANIDDNVGRLLKKLDDLKIAENTLVIYMHDNGVARPPAYTAGLRGQKGTVYEGGIRSPFFMRWPGRIDARVVEDLLAVHTDVMPTILDACGVKPPEAGRLDGRSLLMRVNKVESRWPDRTVFAQWHRGDVPVRYHNFAAITERWKLLNSTNVGIETLPGEPKFELYDLQSDPGESHNVASEHPEIVANLKKQYEVWFTDVSSTRPDNYTPPRIVIGHGDTSPVILTPQDIRMRGQGRGWDAPGAWLVRVEAARDYAIRFRLKQPVATPTEAILKVGGVERHTQIAAGKSECLLEGIRLEPGDAELQAHTVQSKDGKVVHTNVFQVDVMW